jgi:hypothetical protein
MASGAEGRPEPHAGRSGGWAAGPAPARRPLLALAATALLGLLAVAAVVLAAGGGSGSGAGARPGAAPARSAPAATAGAGAGSAKTSSGHYGGLPSWLPKPKTSVRRTLGATVARPVLAIEGETVAVALPGRALLATAVGPSVPTPRGTGPVPPSAPCTFIVTFARASGAIALDAGAFSIVDAFGDVVRPHVTGLHGGAPPALVAPGQTVSIALHDVLPTGNGTLRWAPAGSRPLVSWDFAVELD